MTVSTAPVSTSVAAAAPVAARRRSVTAGTVGLVAGLLIILGLLAAAWLYPLPYDPDAISGDFNQAPSSAHWFGTDAVGGDLFSRTIRAARTDLPLALSGTALALVLGVVGGLLASGHGPWGERFMRVLDTFQSLPLLIITIALVAMSGNRLYMVAVAIAMISGPFFVRLVRSQALSLRESRFVEASVAAGASPVRVMARHLLPNMRSLVLAQTALTAANALLVVAALSFIGVGVQVPTPSWGSMVQTGGKLLTTGQWWLTVFPAAAIFLCVLSFNMIADGLRDRSAGRRERS
jgi:peptide/nickel transport system permease protein